MNFPTLPETSPSVIGMQAYSRILGSIRAAQSEFHPRWWHASLQIGDRGLETGPFPLGEGGTGHLILDPANRLIRGAGLNGPLEVTLGGPASAVGMETINKLGGSIDLDPERWDAITVTEFEAAEAADYHAVLRAVRDTFAGFRDTLTGEVGPIQLWPHHFDMSFEWYSEGVEVNEEEDGPKESNRQIGFGFSPGDEGEPQPYFYANPWPFDESFRTVPLPHGATWHTEGWSGGFLPYTEVAENGVDVLLAYLLAVYEGTHQALL